MSCRSRHPRRWNQQHHRRRQPRGVPAADRQLVNFCFFSKRLPMLINLQPRRWCFAGMRSADSLPWDWLPLVETTFLRRIEAMRGVVMISDRWR